MKSNTATSADADVILSVTPLGFPWQTHDPFLFCVHHDDAYPAGNEQLGPAASLAGRKLGQDFAGKDGWRMYHGEVVPGFPQHPHRGFETVTIVRRGLLDHSDSLGATARFGSGDVQWLTAGKGIVHSEMFPLRRARAAEPAGAVPDLAEPAGAPTRWSTPHFTMLWAPTIPRRTFTDDAGRPTEVAVVAGELGEATPPAPPPDSWASRADSDVAIWTIKMAPGARWTLPPAARGIEPHALFLPRPRPARRRARDPAIARDRGARRSRARARGRRDREPRSCCCRGARSASRSCSTARS